MRRPRSVVAAFAFWGAGALLNLVSAIVIVSLAKAVATVVLVALILAIVLALVQLAFAFLMFRGRNWARIVLTVFAGVQVFVALANFATTQGVNWAGLALIAAGTVFMYTPTATDYFRRR